MSIIAREIIEETEEEGRNEKRNERERRDRETVQSTLMLLPSTVVAISARNNF